MEELKALQRQTNFRTHPLNLLGSFAVCAIDQKRSLISKRSFSGYFIPAEGKDNELCPIAPTN